MEILVTHVTRMRGTRICVAGIDLNSSRHVRPTTSAGDPLTTADLRVNGGPYALGAIVELGHGIDRPAPPEIEDHVVTRSAARFVEQQPWDFLFKTLAGLAESSLRTVFGAELERDGGTYSLPPGSGDRSLGIIRISSLSTLVVRYGRVRLQTRMVGRDVALAVTDVRTWDYAAAAPDSRTVPRLSAAIGWGAGALACVGLSQPWQREDDTRGPRHWVQVNTVVTQSEIP